MSKRGFCAAFALLIVCAFSLSAADDSAEADLEPAALTAEPVKEKPGPLTVNELFKSLKRGDHVLIGYDKDVTVRGVVLKIRAGKLYLDLSMNQETPLVGILEVEKGRIRKIKVLPALPAEAVKKIEEKMKEDLKRASDAYEEMLQKQHLREKEEEELKQKAAEQVKLPQLTTSQLDLLESFPVEEGWGLAKLNDIKRRWFINDLPPTAQEREFTRVYDEWEEARAIYQLYEKAREEAQKDLEENSKKEKEFKAIKEEVKKELIEEEKATSESPAPGEKPGQSKEESEESPSD